MNNFNFRYYYGNQAEQFSFYRIPKLLFTDDYFDKLTSDAKILYGVMLDRMSLSMKNDWIDNEDRVYIIFTIEDVREMMRCGEQKAVKLLAELDSVNGIGLIEKKRQGLGKPNIIYVKNFVKDNGTEGRVQDFQSCENEEFLNSENAQVKNCENEEFLNSENTQVKSCENEEFLNNENVQVKNCEYQSSRTAKITDPKLLKSQSNYTNINNTNNTKSNNQIISYPSYHQSSECISNDAKKNSCNQGISMSKYLSLIKRQIDYDCLIADYEKDEIDEIVDLILETICMKRDQIRIAGAEQPYELVKSKFMKLNAMHIRYVIDCMKENRTKVRNIKSYMLTALFNASSTINMYYQTKMNSDIQ